MMIFLITLHVIACLFLIAVILLQAGKGHGLAGSSFGSEMQTVLGTRTADFMSKVTTVCAILFLVTCLTIDVVSTYRGRSLLSGQGTEQFSEEQMQELLKSLEKAQGEAGGELEETLLEESQADVAEETSKALEKVVNTAPEVAQTVVPEGTPETV